MPSSAVSSNFLGSHAIVIGGGIAGLLSAHVLTSYFEHVSLIERDYYPEEPVFRAGVPQGRHVHIMLARGQQLLKESSQRESQNWRIVTLIVSLNCYPQRPQ